MRKASDPTPFKGDVRLRGGPTSTQTQVEVWDGESWVQLSGVVEVKYGVKAGDLPFLELHMYTRSVELDLRAKNVLVIAHDDGGDIEKAMDSEVR